MDTQIRRLERQAANGDTGAALQLARKRDKLRMALTPCIVLCPRGTNLIRKRNGKLSYFRAEYVSIFLDMGPWEEHPTVAVVGYGSFELRLSNDFFLRNLKKARRM